MYEFSIVFVLQYRDGGSSRMNASDRVKKIVQEEGRTARNLVLYHVPVQDNQLGTGMFASFLCR